MAPDSLTIAVLGAGNIGRALGKKWYDAGYTVIFGVTDPHGTNAQKLRSEINDTVTIGNLDEILQGKPDVVLFALPGDVVEQVVQNYAASLNGCIIIDAANRMGEDSLHNLEHFQQHTPQAHVYRAFNSLGWENFAEPDFAGVQADLFYCGPEGESLSTIEQLISAVGLRPIHLGDNDQAGLLDSITALWFNLALKQKKGRHLSFKVLGI